MDQFEKIIEALPKNDLQSMRTIQEMIVQGIKTIKLIDNKELIIFHGSEEVEDNVFRAYADVRFKNSNGDIEDYNPKNDLAKSISDRIGFLAMELAMHKRMHKFPDDYDDFIPLT